MFSETGAVKVTDFGVAKILSEQMTQADMVLGTLSYMAPEQIESNGVTGRTDQFSMAVMAYELLTGEKPLTGGSKRCLRESGGPAVGQEETSIAASPGGAAGSAGPVIVPPALTESLEPPARIELATC